MVLVIAVLVSCLVIEGFPRAAGKAQCGASGTKCAEGMAQCDASDAKCGHSFLQRGGKGRLIEDVKADDGTGSSSITHEACPAMDARHVRCGNQLNSEKSKGCPSDYMDCTATTAASCKQLCDANSGCKSFALRTEGCQLCSTDGEATTESIGDSVYSQQCSASMTAPTPSPTPASSGPKSYVANGIGMCKDASGANPSWNWASTTEQSAIDACDAEPTCSGYGYSASGKYQYFCNSSAVTGTCTNKGNGHGPVVRGNGEKHTKPCMLVSTRKLLQQYYSKWMQELPGDVTTGSVFVKLGSCKPWWYNTRGKRHDAYAIGPQCTPPAKGFPGLIMIPGKAGLKSRHIMFENMLAGRGIVSVGVDMCYKGAVYAMNEVVVTVKLAISWMNSTTWDNIPHFGGLQLGVNPNDLSIMGYSGGAETINSMLYTTNQGVLDFRDKIANFISISGVRWAHANNQDMEHLDSSWPNYIAIQADNDGPMGGADQAVKFVSRLQRYGLKAFLVHYQTGGHQPFKPSMFYEVSLFIADPENYQEVPYPLFNDGDIDGVWEELPNSAMACYGNLEPLRLMQADNWNGNHGRQVCRNYCLQLEGCAGFDLLDPRVRDPDIGSLNCMLYSEQCANPSRSTRQPSEFLQQRYVGMANPTYCRKEGNEFGYNYHDTLQCGGASTSIGKVIAGQTSVSCAKLCDDSAECEGFQLAVLKAGKCQLIKDIIIEKCAFHKKWMVYVKK